MKNKLLLNFIFILIITACTPKADIFIQATGDAVITVDIKTGKTMELFLENALTFSSSDKKNSSSIFNTEQIKGELEAKGIKVLSIYPHSIAGINTKFKVFNKNMNQENTFIKTDIKKGILSVSISPSNIQEFVSLLSDEDKSYADLLMAPAITGESIEKDEYEMLITAAYGEKLARELKKSIFQLNITCPKKIHSITSTSQAITASEGNKARINVPLLDILCLKESFYAEVRFTP